MQMLDLVGLHGAAFLVGIRHAHHRFALRDDGHYLGTMRIQFVLAIGLDLGVTLDDQVHGTEQRLGRLLVVREERIGGQFGSGCDSGSL